MNNDSLYKLWRSVISKCYNPDTTGYANYGAKGIRVYDEWKNSFEAFKEWAHSHGVTSEVRERDKLVLARYDTKGDFTPENCYFENRHRTSNSKIYHLWTNMMKRCYGDNKRMV